MNKVERIFNYQNREIHYFNYLYNRRAFYHKDFRKLDNDFLIKNAKYIIDNDYFDDFYEVDKLEFKYD